MPAAGPGFNPWQTKEALEAAGLQSRNWDGFLPRGQGFHFTGGESSTFPYRWKNERDSLILKGGAVLRVGGCGTPALGGQSCLAMRPLQPVLRGDSPSEQRRVPVVSVFGNHRDGFKFMWTPLSLCIKPGKTSLMCLKGNSVARREKRPLCDLVFIKLCLSITKEKESCLKQ